MFECGSLPPCKRVKETPCVATNQQHRRAVVDTLPSVILTTVLEFADHDSLHAIENTSHFLRQIVHTEGLWEKLVRRLVAFGNDDAPVGETEWRHLMCLAAKPCDYTVGLLTDVTACSAVDRPVESPSNTLTPSRCWLSLRSSSDRSLHNHDRSEDHLNLANIAQIQCGCEMGDACYWSTTPSRDKNAVDYIDYSVRAKSVMHRLQILPYRAFWHPDSPVYGPCAVSVSFYSLYSAAAGTNSSQKELIYESPVFPLVNEMQLQELALPQAVWLPNGAIMRLNLIGRYQAETFELPPWVPAEDQVPHYYTCLSFVNAVGLTATTTTPHHQPEHSR